MKQSTKKIITVLFTSSALAFSLKVIGKLWFQRRRKDLDNKQAIRSNTDALKTAPGSDAEIKRLPGLDYLIENECFITSQLVPSDQFIDYCNARGVKTSREQLEQFEKLGLFYPVARVRYFTVKVKIEKIDGDQYRELGTLQDGEEWGGETYDRRSSFRFEKEIMDKYLESGSLWDPRLRQFEGWDQFRDGLGMAIVESYYSIFQCHTLYLLNEFTKFTIKLEWLPPYGNQNMEELVKHLIRDAEYEISYLQNEGVWASSAPMICQIISNRYLPLTQTDRRSYRLSIPSRYRRNWDWREYSRNWDARAILSDLGITLDELKKLQERVARDAEAVDPLSNWYDIVSFVSFDEKNRLKGGALLAQTFYSMEHMLRLFYEDITGQKLMAPDQSYFWDRDKFYGEGVTSNELLYLEFLTNKYHLNPRPSLILVVEGHGEEEQFSRLTEEFFGAALPRFGVQVMNLGGISHFEGSGTYDKHGALARFIDYFHDRQTLVFVILDREGRRVETIKNKIIEAHSRYHPERTITKEEYIHLWDKNVEFDNFSSDEIARAMSQLSKQRGTEYDFKPEDIEECNRRFGSVSGDTLSNIYMEKVSHGLEKRKLLRILFDYIISDPKKEFDEAGKARRPIVQVIGRVLELASRNHQPINFDVWKKNQESGYFGDPIKAKT